jgi:hypothetical protein
VRIPEGRLIERLQHMLAEIDLSRLVRKLRDVKNRGDLRQDLKKGAALAQSPEHFGRRRAHYPANQLRPYFGRLGATQSAGLDLSGHEPQRFVIRVGLRFCKERRHAQDAQPRMGLDEIS